MDKQDKRTLAIGNVLKRKRKGHPNEPPALGRSFGTLSLRLRWPIQLSTLRSCVKAWKRINGLYGERTSPTIATVSFTLASMAPKPL